jgi:VanZ family protein
LQRNNLKRFYYFFQATIFLALMTVLLTMPGSAFPQENWFSKIWFDKWIHLGSFMVMVILWCLAVYKFSSARKDFAVAFVVIMISVILYGVGMEFVQLYLVANRSFDIWDIVANTAGAVIGWQICRRRYIKK